MGAQCLKHSFLGIVHPTYLSYLCTRISNMSIIINIKVKMKKIVMMMFAALFAMNVLADNVKFQIKNLNCENCAKRAEI